MDAAVNPEVAAAEKAEAARKEELRKQQAKALAVSELPHCLLYKQKDTKRPRKGFKNLKNKKRNKKKQSCMKKSMLQGIIMGASAPQIQTSCLLLHISWHMCWSCFLKVLSVRPSLWSDVKRNVSCATANIHVNLECLSWQERQSKLAASCVHNFPLQLVQHASAAYKACLAESAALSFASHSPWSWCRLLLLRCLMAYNAFIKHWMPSIILKQQQCFTSNGCVAAAQYSASKGLP